MNSNEITATAPSQAVGTVDVVVTNPGGETGSVTGLFTYTEAYTLIPSTTEVVAGGELTVSWTAQGGSRADWIGLFRVGAANEDYGWWIYTGGGPAGISELTAPTAAGKYECRYLLDDDYFDTVRSAPVTVTPGAVPGGAR